MNYGGIYCENFDKTVIMRYYYIKTQWVHIGHKQTSLPGLILNNRIFSLTSDETSHENHLNANNSHPEAYTPYGDVRNI